MDDAGRLELRERFAGLWARGQTTPRAGATRGARDASWMLAELTVHVDDVDACIADARHRVGVSGHVALHGLCARTPLTGEAALYVPDGDMGMKRCEFRLRVALGEEGAVWLDATAFVRPGRATRAERGTLYVRVRGDETQASVIGAGVVRGRLWDRWRLRTTRSVAHARWRRFVAAELGSPLAPVAS